MQLVRQTIEPSEAELPGVELVADRFKLQKRRWRGEAEDGADFGFELAEPLGHGAVFFESATHRYRIRQTPEPVLAIPLAGDATEAAETGWQIGNLHMPVQVAADEIRVGDDPAVRQLFTGMGIAFSVKEEIFQPMKGSIGAGHSHDHSHDHGVEHSHDHSHG
ncbi:MAG: urease accessory protein UreE [Verrucomicrobiota bacterium]|nr:urease accessory protein UreE [Verrucomicrobiota bacterium]